MIEQWVEDVFASFNDKPDDVRNNNKTANGNGKPRGNNPALISRNAAAIPPEKIDWLWAGRIARGKHTCIAGEPGTGKSQLSIIITAVMTTSGGWPCDEGWAPLGNVINLSAEDSAADTIVPRLIAAGADLERVTIVSAVRNYNGKGQRSFNLQTDIEALERKITEIGDVVLVIVDPVSSYLGKTDSHKNSEVRGVLEPLSEMAERCRVAVLTVTHFNKTGANNTTRALHRFIGSIAFTGAPRTAFAVIEDAENAGRHLFLHAKNNLAPPPQGLAFRLEQTIVADGIVASRVAWESEPVTITANQALAAEADGTGKRSAEEEAEEFLRDILSDGPVPQQEIKEAAEGNGVAWATVRRAKGRLNVKPYKSPTEDGPWLWELPKAVEGAQKVEDAHTINVSTFENLSTFEGMGGSGLPEQAPAPDPTEVPSPIEPDRTCRQCNGALDGTERPYSVNGSQAWLHPQCRRFFEG